LDTLRLFLSQILVGKVGKLKETLPNLVETILKKEVWESKSSNHDQTGRFTALKTSAFTG
jgi:hypothetical protein